jgi:hypothetical protein
MENYYLTNYVDTLNETEINHTYDPFPYTKIEAKYHNIRSKKNKFCIEQETESGKTVYLHLKYHYMQVLNYGGDIDYDVIDDDIDESYFDPTIAEYNFKLYNDSFSAKIIPNINLYITISEMNYLIDSHKVFIYLDELINKKMQNVYALINYLDMLNKSIINYTYDPFPYTKIEATYADIRNKQNKFCIEQNTKSGQTVYVHLKYYFMDCKSYGDIDKNDVIEDIDEHYFDPIRDVYIFDLYNNSFSETVIPSINLYIYVSQINKLIDSHKVFIYSDELINKQIPSFLIDPNAGPIPDLGTVNTQFPSDTLIDELVSYPVRAPVPIPISYPPFLPDDPLHDVPIPAHIPIPINYAPLPDVPIPAHVPIPINYAPLPDRISITAPLPAPLPTSHLISSNSVLPESLPSDISEVTQSAEEQHAILTKLYENMTNVDYIRDKTPDEIRELNLSFQTKLNKFKKIYNSGCYTASIKIFEDTIKQGKERTSTLELFKEPNMNFNEAISEKTDAELNIITEISMFTKNSASKTFIFIAKHNSRPCYIKAFFISENQQLYEQKIYRYIQTRNEKIKPYYQDYFVELYDVCKVSTDNFMIFLDNNRVINKGTSQKWFLYRELLKKLSSDTHIYLIITEDIQGITYEEFYRTNYRDENLMTNTLFDMIYGIYLMNSRLNLFHNDNHFGNVLIKVNQPIVKTKYQIDKIEYTRNKNYRLCFYDFDLSFLKGENNPVLNSNSWLMQNKPSAKDIWTLINSLVFFRPRVNSSGSDLREKEYFLNKILNKDIVDPIYWTTANKDLYKNLNYIENIIGVILNNSSSYIKNFQTIFTERLDDPQIKFWNAYCVSNIQKPCTIPNEPSLYALPVLYRYINDERINKFLGLTEVNAFYTKYIKYKTKYLELVKSK